MLTKVEIQKIHPRATLPTYGTRHSAGADLRVVIDQESEGQEKIAGSITLQPGEVRLMNTGLRVFIKDPNYVGVIAPRSGLGHKKGIILGNTVGVIDADYNGELMISLWNRSSEPVEIIDQQAVAQYLILPVFQVNFEEVSEFSETTDRGAGGFGHTGQ